MVCFWTAFFILRFRQVCEQPWCEGLCVYRAAAVMAWVNDIGTVLKTAKIVFVVVGNVCVCHSIDCVNGKTLRTTVINWAVYLFFDSGSSGPPQLPGRLAKCGSCVAAVAAWLNITSQFSRSSWESQQSDIPHPLYLTGRNRPLAIQISRTSTRRTAPINIP